MRNIFSTCGWLNKCLKLTRNHFSWKGSFFLLNFPMVDSSPPTGEDLLRDCLSPPDEGLGRGSPLRGVCLPPPDRGLWRKGLSRMLMTPFPSKIKLQSHNKYKKQFTCCVVLKLLLVVLFPFLNFDDVVSVTSVHVVRSLGEGVVVSVWLREDVVVSGLPVELLGRVVGVSWDDVHIHVVRVIQVVTFSVLVSMFLVVETDGLRLVVVVVVNVVVLVLVFGVDFSFSCLFELLKRKKCIHWNKNNIYFVLLYPAERKTSQNVTWAMPSFMSKQLNIDGFFSQFEHLISMPKFTLTQTPMTIRLRISLSVMVDITIDLLLLLG